MKRANTEVRLEIYKRARAELGGAWVPALQSRANDFQARVLVKGARTKVSNEGFSMLAATSKKSLSEGLVPAYQNAGAEWGARVRRRTIATHSRRGKAYTVRRRINKQFLPRRKLGHVVMPAAQELGTKLVALWVRVIVETYRDAAEGKP